MGHHYFFALALPESVKKQLHQVFHEHNLPFARAVHEQDLHLTLAFLGEAEEEKLEKARENMAEVLRTFSPFSLTIDSFGTFGKQEQPRIFWAGVKQEPKLHQLQQAVSSACREAGFQLESRPFRPHITLARKWRGEEAYVPQLAPSAMQFFSEEVVLYKTHLDRSPKYEEYDTFLVTE
ncbi:RNA 2',3'-cyclic phosphodiesterase [Bacillus sp. FJAT-42315]|uniref:RNA 2',3'-cyclic phosphodiesterase n=1 Tax=Bacillus sp. FJAT-42315 TaxID=2014077 RepID=UPI000C242BF9|nr:RNA 2',3'-cyclic phosphodiesterase [Bacillus sp. FJAT-42315]